MKDNHKLSVIIAAAGSSTRFGENILKQFILLNNKPLLLYSLENFSVIENITEIIITTNDITRTEKLLKENDLLTQKEIKIVSGGELRQDSVYNGFCKVNPVCSHVIIHDVARPLFEIEALERCIEKAYVYGAAVLGVQAVDTIKKVKSSHSNELIVEKTLQREELYLIQTPQVISYDLLSKIYKDHTGSYTSKKIVTDEATMVEQLGEPVHIVIGSSKNIKITYPEDLEIAELLIENSKSPAKGLP